MNFSNTLLALALMLSPLTAMGYQTADNLQQGKQLVKGDGYVLVTYARDWDKYSKKTAELMLTDPAVTKALGDAVVMKLDVPNVTTKEETEQLKERFPGLDLSFPNVYPAFILYDKDGRRLADVCIPFAERKNPAAVAKKLATAMAAARKQAGLLAKAATATGVEKARLLGEAATVPGINRPKDIGKQIQAADPENKSGMQKIATLNLFDRAIQTGKTEDWEADLAEMKGLIDNPLLTPFQKQQACCIAIGLLRRHGGAARSAELKQMINKLRALDPNSLLGKSAIDARRLWVSELTLVQGWTPGVLPAGATPVELQGKLPIKTAGTYKVTFQYTRGTEALRIAAVELYDGSEKVAEDRHDGSTGHASKNNVYTLSVPSTVLDPHVRIIFNMGAKRDSYGKITITKE